jgi:transcriptional antiterminator NusG
MEKQWYIIQLAAGYEEKVKEEIRKRVVEQDKKDDFGDILIPEVKSTHHASYGLMKDDVVGVEQLFPGYMVINMLPSLDNFRLVKTVYRVIRFLGGTSPVALSDDEVSRILSQISGKIEVKAASDMTYMVGDRVEVIDGPFNTFSGVVESVDEDKSRLVVMIVIFGRLTPIDVSFSQVKK